MAATIDDSRIIAYVEADLTRGTVNPKQVICTQYDAEMRVIAVCLRQNGKDWQIPAGYQVNVRMKKSDGTSVYNPQQGAGNVAYVTLSAQMCGVEGVQKFVVEIVSGSDVAQTVPIELRVIKNPIEDQDFTSEDEKETIQQAVKDAQDAAEESQENANQAYTWAQNTLTLYHQTEDLAEQVEQIAQDIFEVGVRVEMLSQEQYSALDEPDPKTVYIVTADDDPIPYLKAYYPLTSDVADMLGGKTGFIVGGGSFADGALRTAPAGTVSQHQNYIQLPENMFEGLELSDYDGITIALDVMPDTTCTAGNGDWVRLLQFYKPANQPEGTGEGDVYLTQGCIGTAYYNGVQTQALDAAVADAITAGSWHTVAMVINGFGTGVTVYVDGAKKVSVSGPQSQVIGQMQNFTQNYIGNSRFGDNDFVGRVKNLRVYNKALSAQEISSIGSAPSWTLYFGGAKMDDLVRLQETVEGIIGGTVNIQTIRGAYGQSMDIGPDSIGEMHIGSTSSASPVNLRASVVNLHGMGRGPGIYEKVRITGVADPEEEDDAATKGYVDTQLEPALNAAIRPTVTGNPIHVEDSAEAPVQGLCVYGRTEQVTTTGAQLLNPALYDANLSSNGVSFTNEDGSVYINGTATGTTNGYYLGEYIDVLSDGAEYVPSGGNNLAFFTIRISYSNGDPDSYTTNAFAVDKSTMSSIKPYFQVQSGVTVNDIFYPMLNAGSTALPWEPYTSGKPSPSPEYPQELVSAEDVSVTLSDGGDGSQTLTLTGDLPGIPVDSGGNYTDPDGQQWVCNYRDWSRGVDVQMVAQETIAGTTNFIETESTGRFSWSKDNGNIYKDGETLALATFAQWKRWGTHDAEKDVFAINYKTLYFSPAETMTADEVNALLPP